MISQHWQTATLPNRASRQQVLLEAQKQSGELQKFIALGPDAREARKAIAVKLVYQGYLYEEIQTIQDVSRGSITGWKQANEENRVDGVPVKYKGKKSYLSAKQREEVLIWLQTKDYWELGELE